MEVVGILLGVLALVGGAAWLLDRRVARTGDAARADALPCEAPEPGCSDEDCAARGTCPAVELIAAEVAAGAAPPVYFDDEELDGYRGRGCDDYDDADLEQWRDVLYTLRPADRLPWQRSVERRGIVMPRVIRDELVMLLSDDGPSSAGRDGGPS